MKRLFISVDNEGVGGVVTWESHGRPGAFEYERMREWMTNEALAAVEAALEWGVDEVIVADSHGNGENLLVDRFPQNGVSIVRSWPRPLSMAEGVELPGVIAAMFIGYHTSTVAEAGGLRHVLSSARFTDIRVNGVSASETTIHAAIAGHYGVPLILVSGDDAYTDYAQKLLGDVEAVTTKWARGFTSARTLVPAQCATLIGEASTRALQRLSEFSVYSIPGPIELEIDFRNVLAAELSAYLPGVEKTGSLSIRCELDDIVAVSKFLGFLAQYK